jgi:pimeloyl-ACP methyl ester carboxylesterase
MNPISRFLSTFFLIIFVFQLGAQQKSLHGFWIGKVDLPTVKLTTIFKIVEDESGNYILTLDIPEQSAKGLESEIIRQTPDSLIFITHKINRTFYGEFLNDSTLKGDWTKNRMSIPLTLHKSNKAPVLKRPQTPQAPFPYNSEDVEYLNPKSGFKLAGTLTFPEKAKNCPAVVMITGSGAQDRDETIFEHKMFWVVADYFARNGIAVLRVDDRGVGGSEGNISEATSQDFADDVFAGVEFLKSRKEIDARKIGLIGHSEGGLIAPIAANNSSDISYFIMMAGPGMVGEQILYEQNDLALKAAGMPEYVINQNRLVQKAIFDVLKNESDSAEVINRLRATLSGGMYPGMNDDMKKAVDAQIAGVNTSWFKCFLSYDPQPTLAKVKCPVLAINGVKDVQVPVTNLDSIKRAINEGGNLGVTTIRFENLNHLFQNCETGAVAEYAQIEETIDPIVLKTMKDWILEIILK